MKRMRTEMIEKINIVDNYLTLILFISTIVMILLHFSTKFNVIFAVVFCVFLVLNWFSKPLNYNNSIDIIIIPITKLFLGAFITLLLSNLAFTNGEYIGRFIYSILY